MVKTLREYQKESMLLFDEINEVIGRTWNPFIMATDLLEEAGEVAAVNKGLEGYKPPEKPMTRDMLVNELCDVLYILMLLAETYGVDIEERFPVILDSYRRRFLG